VNFIVLLCTSQLEFLPLKDTIQHLHVLQQSFPTQTYHQNISLFYEQVAEFFLVLYVRILYISIKVAEFH